MGKKETDLAERIRDTTLELLMTKEPEEVKTRDIAAACGVTATSLYYYYKDRETLFNEIKLYCLGKMNEAVLEKMNATANKSRALGTKLLYEEFKAGLKAFRDWAFQNPRMAVLVMGRIKADTGAESEKLDQYYSLTMTAKQKFDTAVKAGLFDSKDTLLDISLCIAALWGAIEAVILNRTIPHYWTKQGSVYFTDKMINLLLSAFLKKGETSI